MTAVHRLRAQVVRLRGQPLPVDVQRAAIPPAGKLHTHRRIRMPCAVPTPPRQRAAGSDASWPDAGARRVASMGFAAALQPENRGRACHFRIPITARFLHIPAGCRAFSSRKHSFVVWRNIKTRERSATCRAKSILLSQSLSGGRFGGGAPLPCGGMAPPRPCRCEGQSPRCPCISSSLADHGANPYY